MDAIAHSMRCPICRIRPLETLARAFYARGYWIAFGTGEVVILGCRRCVARRLRIEAGKSLLYGWFSPTALALNLFFIPWNLIGSLFVRRTPRAVAGHVEEAGIPQPSAPERIAKAFYSLAAQAARRGGEINAPRLNAMLELGPTIVERFDPAAFNRYAVGEEAAMPLGEIGAALKNAMTAERKSRLVRCLIELMREQAGLSREDDRLIERLAEKMGYAPLSYRAFRAKVLAELG